MKYADIQHTDFKVSDFLSWQRAGSLELSPSFQRRPVWSAGAKSYLVDTIVRGLPVPVIFLRSVPSDAVRFEPKREVVDGQQRIRTLISFIAPDLLTDLNPTRDKFTVQRNHNRELAGKTFDQLDPAIQQRMLDYEFSVHVFPSDTDDREILQIFARMNATGVKLNAQELRNAEFFGIFKTTMYELAAEQLSRWRNWGVFSEYNIARMEEVELTSEFAMLMLTGISKKEQAAIKATYRRYEDHFAEGGEVARRFHSVMDSRTQPVLATVPVDVTVPLASDGLWVAAVGDSTGVTRLSSRRLAPRGRAGAAIAACAPSVTRHERAGRCQLIIGGLKAGAGSGRRAEVLVQRLGGRSPIERLAGSAVQRGGDRGEVIGAVAGQVGALGEVLAQQPVGVLVGAALPRAVWIAEVDRQAGLDPQLRVVCHLGALIPGQRPA